jgi:hypothetical protein
MDGSEAELPSRRAHRRPIKVAQPDLPPGDLFSHLASHRRTGECFPKSLAGALRAAPMLASRRAMGNPPHTGVAELRRGALSPHPHRSGPPAAPVPFALPLNQRSRERKSRGIREEGERRRGVEHHRAVAQG